MFLYTYKAPKREKRVHRIMVIIAPFQGAELGSIPSVRISLLEALFTYARMAEWLRRAT